MISFASCVSLISWLFIVIPCICLLFKISQDNASTVTMNNNEDTRMTKATGLRSVEGLSLTTPRPVNAWLFSTQ